MMKRNHTSPDDLVPDLTKLQVSDLSSLITRATTTRENRVTEATAKLGELERRISATRVERLELFQKFTDDRIAPMLIERDQLREAAGRTRRSPSEAGRWLKNQKSALRRRLQKEGNESEYSLAATRLSLSKEYARRDPYSVYVKEHAEGFCKACNRVILPSDWQSVWRLRREREDSTGASDLADERSHRSVQNLSLGEMLARLATNEDDNRGNE